MFRHQGPEGKEDGAFITGEVLFKPVAGPFSNRFLDVLLTPRPDLGFSVSTEDGTDQVYGGFTWTVPLPWVFFLEASFGGRFMMVHCRMRTWRSDAACFSAKVSA